MPNEKNIDCRPKILVIPGTEFLRIYSGTLYLLQHLNQDFSLEILVRTTPENRSEYAKLGLPCKVWSWWSPRWNFLLRRFSDLLYRFWILWKMSTAPRILITEGNYLREAALIKKWRGKKLFLFHFCQELVTLKDYPGYRWAAIYEKYAKTPDGVADVDPCRAKERMAYFCLDKMPFVLRNTLPATSIPQRSPPGTLFRIAGIESMVHSRPIVLHMGGIGKEKPLERVIDAIASASRPSFFLAFCSAPAAIIDEMNTYASRKLPPGSFCILPPRSRQELLSAIWEADIGVIDYAFSVEPTLNQKYCAPTKLYEFMACGLAVLGSDNDSLRNIIESERMGLCAHGDAPAALGTALDEMLRDRDALQAMKINARQTFVEKYAYERTCVDEIAKIKQMFLQ